jgi:outer membrane protein TolC
MLLSLALAACAPRHTPEPPLTEKIGAAWNALSDRAARAFSPATEAQPVPVVWWGLFNDAALSELIARADAQNLDIQLANARVREARSLRIITASALYPTVNAGARGSRGSDGNIFNDKPMSLYQAQFDASWEIDLFGGTEAKARAADATIRAREAMVNAARVRVRAEVAKTYVELREAQAHRALTERTIATQMETFTEEFTTIIDLTVAVQITHQ